MKTYHVCVLLALSSMLTCGCAATAIGVGIGAIVDHHHGRTRQATWKDSHKIPRRSHVFITLTSDSTLSGEFTELRALSRECYGSVYDSVRAALGDSVLPALGDTVGVVREGLGLYHRLFHGFGVSALDLRQAADTAASYVPLPAVTELQDFHGRPYDLTRIRSLMAARALPVGKEFVVESDMETLCIRLEQIRAISAQPRPSHYRLLGGAIGLVADVAIWTAIILPAYSKIAPTAW